MRPGRQTEAASVLDTPEAARELTRTALCSDFSLSEPSAMSRPYSLGWRYGNRDA